MSEEKVDYLEVDNPPGQNMFVCPLFHPIKF